MTLAIAKRPKPHAKASQAEAVFLLESGARMNQRRFHELYASTPDGFKAELIEGTVYVASPVSGWHAGPHATLVGWLYVYMDSTLGVRVYNDATNILNSESEPQPDAALLLDEDVDGRTRMDEKGYILGAPELVAEVAHSSASIDLGKKMEVYEREGASEYVVVLVREKRVRWFVRRDYGFEEQRPDVNGVLKSEFYPGLWLSEGSFFDAEPRPLMKILRKGLASPAHAAFVAELKARRTKNRKRKGK